MRTGRDRQTKLEACIPAHLHVLFPLGIAGEVGLAVTGITGCRRPALRSAADGEPLQHLAVETHVELLRPAHPHDVVLVLPPQAHLEQIFPVDREIVAHGDAAPRSKRQVLALPVVLYDMERDRIRRESRVCRRHPDGEPRHLTGHRQVALEMRCRDGEHVRDVVETSIGRVVARQERPDVDVHGQEVANRVVVFGPVETVDGADAPGVRRSGPGAIQLGFQPARGSAVRIGVRARPARRRHRARAQLRDHALPDLGAGGRLCRVQRIERHPCGTQPLVVTSDAVFLDDRLGRWRFSPCGLRSGLRALPRGHRNSRQDGNHNGRNEQRERRPTRAPPHRPPHLAPR